jgi:hypothetical protein
MYSHRCVAALFVILAICLGLASETRAEPTIEKWLRVLGISVTPQTKGPAEDVEIGDLWIVSLPSKVRHRLTLEGGYRSPVFLVGDRDVLAIKGVLVVRIPVSGGEPKTVVAAPGVTQLIGVGASAPNDVLVLTEDEAGRRSIGVLSLIDGKIAKLPTASSEDDRRIIDRLNHVGLVYGDIMLTIETTTEQGLSGSRTWSDVYVTRPGQPKQNVSQCDDVNCGQPSLSHDGSNVVFVKAGGE